MRDIKIHEIRPDTWCCFVRDESVPFADAAVVDGDLMDAFAWVLTKLGAFHEQSES